MNVLLIISLTTICVTFVLFHMTTSEYLLDQTLEYVGRNDASNEQAVARFFDNMKRSYE